MNTWRIRPCRTRSTTAIAVALALGAGSMSADGYAMCYFVHDANDTLIYRSQRAPVSMSSSSLSEAVQRRFPGGQLSINNQLPCIDLDLTSAEGRARAKAQQQRSAGMMGIYFPVAPAYPGEFVAEKSVTPATTPAPETRERIIETRIVETRTEIIHVPVAANVAPTHTYTHNRPHRPGAFIDSTPTVPASLACGDRGAFSFCSDGSRANNPGHFAYGADGKLKNAKSQATVSTPP